MRGMYFVTAHLHCTAIGQRSKESHSFIASGKNDALDQFEAWLKPQLDGRTIADVKVQKISK